MKGVSKPTEKTLLKDLLETVTKDAIEKGLQEGLPKLLGKAGSQQERPLTIFFSRAKGDEDYQH